MSNIPDRDRYVGSGGGFVCTLTLVKTEGGHLASLVITRGLPVPKDEIAVVTKITLESSLCADRGAVATWIGVRCMPAPKLSPLFDSYDEGLHTALAEIITQLKGTHETSDILPK